MIWERSASPLSPRAVFTATNTTFAPRRRGGPGLVEGGAPLRRLPQPLPVDVHADHVVAQMGQPHRGNRSDVARAADHGDGQRPGGRAFKLRVAFLVRHRGPKLLPSRASIPPSAAAPWRNPHAECSRSGAAPG